MKYLLIALLILFPSETMAGSAFEHAAASAALTGGLYLLMSRLGAGGEEKLKGPSLMSAILFSAAMGLGYETMQSIERGDRRLQADDLKANAVGIGAAAGLIWAIDF